MTTGPSASEPSTAARSLADDLRRRDPEALAALLALRPDLMRPVPGDITTLAARAGSAASTARALDDLDRRTLAVAEAMAALPEPTSIAALEAAFPPDAVDSVRPAVDRLVRLALAWGAPDLRLVRTARDALGRYPCGLGPALAETRPRLAGLDARSLEGLLAEAPEPAIEVLAALAWGPPEGRVPEADRPVSTRSARSPVEWLLARDLLVAIGPGTVVLPREVGLALRELQEGRALLHRPSIGPAAPAGEPVPAPVVEAAVGQHALAAVRSVETLLEAWRESPPAVLRRGGLAMRDLAASARALDTEESLAALWIDIALAAGLVARDGEADETWAVTEAFDEWSELEADERWGVLAVTWRDMVRVPALVRGLAAPHEPVHALSDEAVLVDHPRLRRDLLAALADDPGRAPGAAALAMRLCDARPRRWSAQHPAHVAALLAEAEALGITGLGVLGPGGHALAVDGDPAGAIRALLPPPVDHVLLQADLTAIAPGPLPTGLERPLRLMADVESSGAATVFRFSDRSLRRALDSGLDGTAMLELLESASRTGIPQALRYLIEDADRRHGTVRVGLASSYVRCIDAAMATALLADPRCADLGLHELAPAVLASTLPPSRVIAALRDLGYSPVAEAPDGTVVAAPTTRRVPPPAPRPARAPEPLDPALVAATARALHDRAPRPAGGEPPPLDPMPATAVLADLRRAAAERAPLWLGYAADDGTATAVAVEPLRLAGGRLTGVDRGTGEIRSWPVARISATHPL